MIMRMSTKTYNSFRYFTQIVLPALATFLTTVCGVWNMQLGVNIGLTISAIIALFSGILGASSAIYDKEGGKDDEGHSGDIDTDNLHKYVHVSHRASGEA